MLLTEYNEAETMELFREEGRVEGRAEGILETLKGLVRDKLLTVDTAAKRANMTEEQFLTELYQV